MPPFAQSLRHAQISILKIRPVFLRLESSPSLTLAKIEHSARGSTFVQFWNVFLCDLPDCLKIDSHIIMDQNISKSRNPSPWNSRIALAHVCRDLLGSFADYLELPDHCILPVGMSHEIVIPDRYVFTDFLDGTQYVGEVKPVSFHRLTAWLATSSLM